ncbi:hypothetical protein NP493_424g02055 [Ridgeia piscesae]|uniref:Uncharacterized protein n=1 Tax=Ridgeia piscesae TaxID=27915 RepID=A0AAD9L028_RIDPI|nr:hypothetical protein NP493_424g02055 [Ridgeia piscesae]
MYQRTRPKRHSNRRFASLFLVPVISTTSCRVTDRVVIIQNIQIVAACHTLVLRIHSPLRGASNNPFVDVLFHEKRKSPSNRHRSPVANQNGSSISRRHRSS